VYNQVNYKFNILNMFYKSLVRYFDRLEDRVRMKLSHRSIIYAFIGGVGVVLFWRGIWHTADILMAKGGIWFYIFYEPNTIIWTTVMLLLTGLFVSFFIGDRIILSGLKHEKSLEEKTEEEVQKEEFEIKDMMRKVSEIHRDIEVIKNAISKK